MKRYLFSFSATLFVLAGTFTADAYGAEPTQPAPATVTPASNSNDGDDITDNSKPTEQGPSAKPKFRRGPYKPHDEDCTPCLYGCEWNYSTDAIECSAPPKLTCDTWVDIFGPNSDESIGACVDDGIDDLTAAIRSAGLELGEVGELSWCVTSRGQTSCGDDGGVDRPKECWSTDEEPDYCDALCCFLVIISKGCGWCF